MKKYFAAKIGKVLEGYSFPLLKEMNSFAHLTQFKSINPRTFAVFYIAISGFIFAFLLSSHLLANFAANI